MSIAMPRFMDPSFEGSAEFEAGTQEEQAAVRALARDGVAVIDPHIPDFDAVAAEVIRETTKLLPGRGRLQGALAGVMTDAVAVASGIPATVVRRAMMLGGRLDAVARIALTEGRAAVEAVALEVGRPLQPMLASTSASVTEALVVDASAPIHGIAGAAAADLAIVGFPASTHHDACAGNHGRAVRHVDRAQHLAGERPGCRRAA